MLAQAGHGAVAALFTRKDGSGRGIADSAGSGFDRYATQMWMARQSRHVIQLCKRDVSLRQTREKRRPIQARKRFLNHAIGLGPIFYAKDIGGEAWVFA
jgi:hypothetical protein